jgi:hypothetical protein
MGGADYPLRKPMVQTSCLYHNPFNCYCSFYPSGLAKIRVTKSIEGREKKVFKNKENCTASRQLGWMMCENEGFWTGLLSR